MTEKYARLSVGAIASRVGVVQFINTFSADWAVAIICEILVRPSRFVERDGGVGVDGAAPDASKLVPVAGG